MKALLTHRMEKGLSSPDWMKSGKSSKNEEKENEDK